MKRTTKNNNNNRNNNNNNSNNNSNPHNEDFSYTYNDIFNETMYQLNQYIYSTSSLSNVHQNNLPF